MTYHQKWVATAQELGLEVGICERDLLHILIPSMSGMPGCYPSGHRAATPLKGEPPTEAKVCMFCREVPGLEKRYIRIAGPPSPEELQG